MTVSTGAPSSSTTSPSPSGRRPYTPTAISVGLSERSVVEKKGTTSHGFSVILNLFFLSSPFLQKNEHTYSFTTSTSSVAPPLPPSFNARPDSLSPITSSGGGSMIMRHVPNLPPALPYPIPPYSQKALLSSSLITPRNSSSSNSSNSFPSSSPTAGGPLQVPLLQAPSSSTSFPSGMYDVLMMVFVLAVGWIRRMHVWPPWNYRRSTRMVLCTF